MDNFVRPINVVRLDITDMYYALTNYGITPVMTSVALLTLTLVVLYEGYLVAKKKCQPKGRLKASKYKLFLYKAKGGSRHKLNITTRFSL